MDLRRGSILLLVMSGCASILDLDKTPTDEAPSDDAATGTNASSSASSSSSSGSSTSSSSSGATASSSSGSSTSSSSSGSSTSSGAFPPDSGGVRYADLAYAAWPLPPATLRANHYAADDAVVYDQITGLFWQRAVPAERYDYAHAKEYCEALALGGFDDWRLPYRMELVSILDMSGGAAPWVQTTAFPDTPAVAFWSQSFAAAVGTIIPQSWVVHFGSGGVYWQSRIEDNEQAVRCVRGIEQAIPKPSHWTVYPQTVVDNETGLIWQRTPASGWGTLAECVLVCQDLVLDGQSGFRVPNLRELLSMIDETATSYGVDRTAFNVNSTGRFWTTTPLTDNSKRALLDVSYGGSTNAGVATEEVAGIRCVKSP